MVAFFAGAFGEPARGFFAGNAAVDFDDVRFSEEKGDLVALVLSLSTKIGFEHNGGAMRREGPEKFHGRGADTAGELDVAGGAVHGGEQGFLDVVLGEEREAEALGKWAADGGLAGGGWTRDENDAMFHGGSQLSYFGHIKTCKGHFM